MTDRKAIPAATGRKQDTTVAIAWATGCMAILALIAAAKLAADFVAPTVLAGLFALTLAPVVRVLERRRIPSAIASALVVVSMVLAGAFAVYTLAPSAEDWRWKAPSVIRSIERQFRNIEKEISDKVDKATAGRATKLGNQENSPTDAVIESSQKLITDTILAAPQAIVVGFYIGFLCYFLLAERGIILRAVMALAVDWQMRLRIGRAVRDMRQNVGAYLLTFSAINAGLGALAALAFWASGLPNPVLWGAMVAVLNFMPYVGPLIANFVVLAVGLTTFPNLANALLPVALLVSLNVVEGQLVTPTVIGKRSRLGPLSVFLALAFGAWLWGAIGALVATPLLIVAVTFGRHLFQPRHRAARAHGHEAEAA